jgi:hypothetical protein
MKSIAKSLIKIANELDTRGHTGLADRLDKIVLAMTDAGADGIEMSEDKAKVSDEPAGSAAKRKAESQQMRQVQRLLNKYLDTAETIGRPAPKQLGSWGGSIPENGKTGDPRTWTAINLSFPWKPGVDYKNYTQLIKLLQSEIDALESSARAATMARSDAVQEDEREVLSLWSRIIGMDYDPADAAKYKVSSFLDLLDKLENLPPQRGPEDALHRKAEELAYLAKQIKNDPSGSRDSTAGLVKWLKAYMSDRLAAVQSESED